MPLTFPSHAALPLPLKLWRPRWFDGVALTVGAASPDLAYALDGSGLPVFPLSHQWPGLVLFCLPVTLAGALLVRRTAAVAAAHLPRRPAALALRDYGVLGTTRPALAVSVVSALLAAASHLVWDRITEPAPVLDLVSTIGGALVALALAVHVGRHRLLRAWHGDPPARPARPVLFWSVAATGTAVAAGVAAQLPGAFLLHTTGARLLIGLALAVTAAAAAVTLATPRAAPAVATGD
ncbi:hypothetical protein Cme02nite_29510 [Catellatospora methionotrophica]|uniref:DUF4184 family protein n=1 Tax=Catellatospora methionotrophica TaxID=121620 RepID=A0A8J3LFK5_9ACTN|nr:DUF4184 family protein [Catellatospora methionotrophica]GIG14619.1 hypothetical protein Cme02nite_29510 [Catellatospora methionotrophica]